ncbi:hypothetical protein CEXT_422311 [Caerostris extrusa]|uniref:Uncharacterized protein n=1 Tax=Caerostris extrusa TaxID=172846 RepID=A0AAV4U9K2_CAEEX|nr:hypothetical protein CEXT_422311 [Caerostris extrusa]
MADNHESSRSGWWWLLFHLVESLSLCPSKGVTDRIREMLRIVKLKLLVVVVPLGRIKPLRPSEGVTDRIGEQLRQY